MQVSFSYLQDFVSQGGPPTGGPPGTCAFIFSEHKVFIPIIWQFLIPAICMYTHARVHTHTQRHSNFIFLGGKEA